MYLNVNVAANASSADGSCSTPRTPEILNLLAGGPFESGPFGKRHSASLASQAQSNPQAPAASTPGEGPCSPGEHASFSPGSASVSSSPATPGTPSGSGALPSIQNTRTYLIKEGLKLTIQSKRLASGRTPTLDGEPSPVSSQHKLKEELTPEDEERRRRRRERNKLAATKCRNRKKERTGILLQESGTLEDQNVVMRTEIQKLEAEKRRLMDVLSSHSSACLKSGGAGSSTSSYAGGSSSSHYAPYPPVIPVRSTVSPQRQTYPEYPTLSTGTCSPTTAAYTYDCRPPSVSQLTTLATSYDASQCMTYPGDSYSVNAPHPMTFEGSQSYR